MKTPMIYLVIYIATFLPLAWHSGSPEAGYERLHWISIALMSTVPLMAIGLFQFLEWLVSKFQ